MAVLHQLKDFDDWRDNVRYGYRWMVVETVFSSLKRMFGEYVSSRKYPYMVKEVLLKTSLYNMFTDMK